MLSDQGEDRAGKRFSASAFAEATDAAKRTSEILKGRPVVKGITIDGPQSRDLDDALWLERDAQGGYRLLVSVTNVAALVSPQTTPALDREAFERAFTRYYAERNTPMLPRQLSESNLSLLENQARPAIAIAIPIDSKLTPGEPHIYQACLRSNKRFTYDEVDEEINNPQTEFASMLCETYRIALGLLNARRARGALAIYDINAGWATTEEGVLIRLDEYEKNKAHIIIQECMILANQILANYLAQRGIPALYRNHSARAIAPERFTLLKMIDAAMAHPELANPERVWATTNLAMERAKYEPVVAGHFGLNLSAYIHLTSPLRRYPDLVNQRILLAVLEGQPLPYTKSELESMAAHVNAIADTMKEAKKAHFLSEHDEQLRKNIEQSIHPQATSARPLEGLDAKQFHSALRIAAETCELQPAIEQEIYSRLADEGQTLYAHDIFTLVFRFQNDGEEWRRVKIAALQWLQQNPHHAISIFMMGRQTLGWEEPVCELSTVGPANQRRFAARACMYIAGRQYITEIRSAGQKERAKQLAIAELLARIADIGFFLQEAYITHEEENKTADIKNISASYSSEVEDSRLSHNYKGQLQERAQAQKWPNPSYKESARSGPAHAPTFTVTGTIVIADQTYSAEGIGSTRIKAEQNAARNLLQIIPQTLEVVEKIALSANKNAISILNEMLQKRAIADVIYTYQMSGKSNEASFTCACIVKVPDGRTIEMAATGKTKKEATQAAAAQALALLVEVGN